jgi:hypothetical protein
MSPQSHQTNPKIVAAGLSEQLASHLRRRLGGQVSDLRVAIREGGLVLQGRTRTHHAKQIALQAVLDITELPILANEIRVEPAAGRAEAGLAETVVASPLEPDCSSSDTVTGRWEPATGTRSSFLALVAAIWSRGRRPRRRPPLPAHDL